MRRISICVCISTALIAAACCALAAGSASAIVPQGFACIETTFESTFHYPSWEDCWKNMSRGSGKWERLLPQPGEPLPLEFIDSGTLWLLAEGVEMSCGSLKATGSLEVEGKIPLASGSFSACKVVKPTSCSVIKTSGKPNGTIAVVELPTQLVEHEGTVYDELRGAGKEKVIATLEIEQSEGGGKDCGTLGLKDKLLGTSLGAVNVAGQKLEFKGTSGEEQLKVAGLAAKFEATIELRLNDGGKFGVE